MAASRLQNTNFLAGFDCRSNHAKRRAMARSGESTGIAMCQDARAVLDQRGAMLSHATVGFDIGGVDSMRLSEQHGCYVSRRAAA
jgi:hypothetical protein